MELNFAVSRGKIFNAPSAEVSARSSRFSILLLFLFKVSTNLKYERLIYVIRCEYLQEVYPSTEDEPADASRGSNWVTSVEKSLSKCFMN